MNNQRLTKGEEKFLKDAIKKMPEKDKDKLLSQIAPQMIPGGYWTRNHFHLTGFGKEALGKSDLRKFTNMTRNIDVDTLNHVQKMKYGMP